MRIAMKKLPETLYTRNGHPNDKAGQVHSQKKGLLSAFIHEISCLGRNCQLLFILSSRYCQSYYMFWSQQPE